MTTAEELAAIGAAGESERVEFKATTGQRHEAARTLSAMLNDRGGLVVFGVQPDGTVTGQQVSDKTLEDITSACRDIHPAFPPAITRVSVPGCAPHEVLVVEVPAGQSKPYSWRGRCYLRSGAATVAMPDERQLALVLERAHGFDRWELASSDRDVDALDAAVLGAFRAEAIANNRARFDASTDAVAMLRSLSLLDETGLPNRAAMALFATPEALGGQYSMLGAHLVAVDGTVLGEHLADEHLIEAGAFTAIGGAYRWCQARLAQPVRLDGLEARTDTEIPALVIREALANAFAHRDYSTAGHVQVHLFTDRLEVISPGGLHFGLTPDDLYRAHGSHPWNPLILGALYRRGIVDQLGSGTLRMIRLCATARLAPPRFHATPASVTVTLYRPGHYRHPDGTSITLDDTQTRALAALTNGARARGDLADELGLTDSQTRRVLNHLRDLDLVHPSGHGRGARWNLGPSPTE